MENVVPAHVGIIMDGNGRWAKKRGLGRNMGHRQGARVFGDIARHAAKCGVRYLSVYAFSTENWKRSPEEIEGIMSLIRSYLKDIRKYKADNMRLHVIGDKTALAPDIQQMIEDAERESAVCTGMVLNIALNYGSHDELTRAVRIISQKVKDGVLAADAVSPDLISEYLDTAGQPDVDLVIRTSGENRISNFLLWQSAYAEYVFTEVLWPDFSPAHFDAALRDYAARSRRMGGES